ncbi:biorientation of chromosomes in cell division protein 1-like 1 isoform X2 [Anneissia japonica]|uniref:biorientation of chromosomes in cell division protein 1-like 1 isoform X2 n=1 Tax=Anneissia japonica TaxID=1529436 RepID=UPI0014259A97|nr:biorientation of chromosomes in cell division protein 1-like 1 isoform X2 [Anneissia japonica]
MDAAPDVADPILVNDVLQQLKSEGTFDQFRRDCLGDVDTKPAYQNLRQRVENYVSNFLSGVTWSPTMNKNQLRDSLRRQINQSEILAIGVERVIEQVVDPQIQHVFRPKLEEVVQNILKVELDPNSEMGLSGFIPTTCSSNPSQLFSNRVSVNESQPSYANQATSFTGHVSVSTPPIMESSSSVAPPLPYEAPPLPSHSPPPLPEEAPPPPLPESVAPPPPPDEPPSPSQDMDVESTESMDIEETTKSEPLQKSGPFKFMKNLLHKAKEKVKCIIGERNEEESKHDDENMTLESNVVEEKMQILELERTDDKKEGCLDAKDGDAGKGDGGGDDEEDRLTDITVSSVHTSDLSSFTEGISSSSSSDLSDSDDDELKKISDSVEMAGERSLSRCSSLATDSDKGSSKGSGRKSSNLALAISRYHSDSDEDMEKRQERRRKAAEAREERAVLRQQAREEHQKKIEQMKAERLAKKRKKALQEKSNTSDEDTDDRPGRKEKRTRSIQLKEQMKEKLLEKKKEKKRMAAASHSVSEETLSPRKQVTDSKPREIYRFDLVARQLKKPLVKTHYLLCEELPGEEQMNDSNNKEKFRGSDGKHSSAENQEMIEDKLEEGELKEAFDDVLHRPSDASNVEVNESMVDLNIIDSDDKNEQLHSFDVKTKQFSVHVAVESSCWKDKSQEHDGVTIADSNLKTESQKQDYVPVTHSSLKVNSKRNSGVALTSAESSLKDESQDGDKVPETDSSMTVQSQINSDVSITDSSFKDKSHVNSDMAVTDKSREKDAAVTTSSMTGESQINSNVAVTDILRDKSYKNNDVAVTGSRLKDESLEEDDISMTDSNMKDQSDRNTVVDSSFKDVSCETNNIAVSDRFLHGDSQRNRNMEVTEDESQKRNDVAVTDSSLDSSIAVAATESSIEGESQKSDVAVNDGSVKDALVVQTQTSASSKNILLKPLNAHESFKETNKAVMMENNSDSEKKELINDPPRSKDKVGDNHCEVEKEKSDTEDHASPDNVVQEPEKDDNSEENPPTPTQDEPSTLEEIAEDEPAAIPIYSVSPAAYQGPTIGSLFKIGMGDAERSADQANSTASSPLSAISSGDLSGGEEKILEDEEPDEEGEIKDTTESATQEKPNSDGGSRDDKEEVHEGRYGMRSRRKINSPKYSGDEYLWYGFKKRSSGSIEEKGNKETKAGSRTRTTDTERTTRKSLRTDSLSVGKEEGEVYEQQETKKRQKGSTENSASIIPGRRQRQVPRRYSPSESVTGRRGQSPTQREAQTRQSSNRYTEQQPFGERRTRRQQSPIQREASRSRRGTTPPRRGLRRPSGDRASDYPPSKRRR